MRCEARRVTVIRGLAPLVIGGLAWLVLCGAGCRLGPDYERPAVEVPNQWRWKEAAPRDHVPTGPWWSAFGDPTLNSLVEMAGTGNLELKAAFARVEQARATARVSKADFYPALKGAATYSRFRTSANAPSPVGFPIPSFTLEQWETPLDLSYEIDLWGRVRRSFESARGLAMSAEAARRGVLLALEADVVSGYLTLQALDREIQLLARTVEIRNEALEIFRQRLRAGMLTEFEVQRGQVEVASAEADLQAARRIRAAEYDRMAVLCGRPPAVFDFQVSTQAVATPEVAPGLPADLLERRPDVAQAERNLASRMAEIGVAKAAYFPSVRLTASGGLMSGELSNLFEWDSHTWALGPRIDLPIFAGGRNRAGLDRAKAAYEEAVANYRQQVLVAFREVEDGLSALQFLKTELASRRVAAEAATGAARQAFARYQAGAVNFLDVVDAEQARLLSLLAQEGTLREQQLTTVRLMKALGGGWDEAGAL